MSAIIVTHYLEHIRAADAANRRLTELLAAQDSAENDLLEQIRTSWEKRELTLVELHKLYMEYREITRSSYPASWTSAGLPHPNTLHAAAKKA